MVSNHLFSTYQLGPIALANRIVVAPMCQYSAVDGVATDWHLQHLMQLGYSGAGLVMVEATAVQRHGRITHGCLGLYNDDCQIALSRAIASARRWAGPTRFGIQLAHAGRKASCNVPWQRHGHPLAADEDSWPTVSASANSFAPDWPVPRELNKDGIRAIIEAFVAAARRAVQIGFEVIELHGTHGYLGHQFLSPLSNYRTDEYGGSLENRMRFLLELAASVRAALSDSVALGVRMAGTDWVAGGWGPEDAVVLARSLKAIGVHYVCVSSGGLVPHAKIPVGPDYQVPLAAKVKRETGIATRAVGMIWTPQRAEQIIAAGDADMIAMARAFLDDPRWGWHAADELGATVHCPPQYERARADLWPPARRQTAKPTAVRPQAR